MAKKVINVGTNANPTGDSLKNAFTKVNDNFTELYNALGLTDGSVNVGAFEFSGSTNGIATMTTTDSSAILIDQTVTVGSDLTVGGDIFPSVANGGDLGSSAKPWRSLYVSNNTIYLGGTSLAVNQSGQLTINGSTITAGSVAWNNVTGKPTVPDGDRLINATDKIVLNEEGATRLSMYLNNVEKTRIQINGNDLLLSSLSGGVVLAATDGVGGEWRFKTNGNLESTGGNFLSAAETPAVFGSLNSTSTGASSGTVTLKSGTGNVDGGSIYIEAGTGSSGNDGEVTIRTGSGPYEWVFDNGGNLTIPGNLTLPNNGYIITDHDQNLNLRTSYNTSVPGQTITADDSQGGITNNWITVLISGGGTNYPGIVAVQPGWTVTGTGLTNEPVTQVEQVNLGGGVVIYKIYTAISSAKQGYTYNFTAPSTTVNTTKTWTLKPTGDLLIPGNIQSQGNIDLEINLADSTMRRWTFGEDGEFTIPGELNVPEKINIGSGGFVEYSGGNFFIDGSNIVIGNSGGMSYWGFNSSTGDITFPDATVQTTAYTGNAATVDVMNTNGIDYNYSITFVENRSATQDLRADVDLTFNSATNTLTAGNVVVKQTITGGIIESGSDFIITSQSNPDRDNACNIGIFPGGATGTASEAGFVSITGGSSDVVGLAGGDVYIRGGAHTNGGIGGTIKVESILKIDDGVHEKFQTKADATGVVTHDCASGHVFYHTSPDANWTVNLTNLNLSSGYATAVTLIIVQGGTGYYPSAVQIGGAGQTLNWQGNATPTPSTNRTDVVTFSIINNSGTYTVLGQMTGF